LDQAKSVPKKEDNLLISWLQEYQGYIVYPSLIIGMMWCLKTMPSKPIIRLPRTLCDAVDPMAAMPQNKIKGAMTNENS
jgi:hypothetical protein